MIQLIFYYNWIQEVSLAAETSRTASVFTKVMCIYLLKVNNACHPNNSFENTMQIFGANMKIIPKAAMHGMRKGERESNDSGSILIIIITVWLFYQDQATVLDDSCPLWWWTLRTCSVYDNNSY